MPSLAPGSVHLVLADLPYGTTANPWDSILPLPRLWEQYRRLLTPKGAIVLTASQPFTSTLVASNLPWFKYSLVWEKENGTNFLNAKYQPFKVHEDIVVFSPAASSYSKRGNMTYNPQMTSGTPYRSNGRKQGLHQFHTRPDRTEIKPNQGTRYPRSVLKFPSEKGLHPTQKPLELMEYLVKTYSHPGETVLDNVMGSGTTGVAALNTDRIFIGIEKDDHYFNLAKTRIETLYKVCQT